jgi:hypothetical protein
MSQIFISYRREESRWSARILYDRLSASFGPKLLFMDIDAIALGEDFVKAIETTVEKCDVLIAVIGNNWLTCKDEQGNRRLDNPDDFVRMEIATALKRDIRVIPVLVDGALMPKSSELPNDLKPLVRRNALQVSDERFDDDCRRLTVAIRQVLEKTAAERTALKEGEQKPTVGETEKLGRPEPFLEAEEEPRSSQVFQPAISILSGLSPRTHAIRSPSMVIGRADRADLVLNFPEISRIHCRIFEKRGRWFIEDFASRIGTIVNGTRIVQRTEIHDGDKIRIGSVTLVFGETRIGFGSTPYFVEPVD